MRCSSVPKSMLRKCKMHFLLSKSWSECHLPAPLGCRTQVRLTNDENNPIGRMFGMFRPPTLILQRSKNRCLFRRTNTCLGAQKIPTTTAINPSAEMKRDPRLSSKTCFTAGAFRLRFELFLAFATFRMQSNRPISPTKDGRPRPRSWSFAQVLREPFSVA